jgi:uncharacterized protein YcgL (UPF0745 family)
MDCFIYKSLKTDGLYLFVRRQDDFSAVLSALLKHFGKIDFVMALALTPERKLARENALTVMQSLQEKGFFVQMPPANAHFPTGLQ